MRKNKSIVPYVAVLAVSVLFFVYVNYYNSPVCQDSDNANIYVKGDCRINGTSYMDSCSGISVKEYSCGADNSCVYTVSLCPQGYSCINGACLAD